MAFQLSDTMNKDKVFLFKRGEIEGRLDPFCYIPSLVFLDNLIKSKTEKRLKDFAVGYSSGATPSKKESDIHYTSKEEGFPFVRVQNLSTTGELNFDNMKYISKETHNGLLNRSKVFAGDLLVKITGVGRMAVASVAPEEFEGNINQHIVVIKTGSMLISQNLSAFINLDCIERLASKRATGGTRPALDYPALFSLPVISDDRFRAKMSEATAAKKQKEAQAQQILDSIDTYLLNELGIKLPSEEENIIGKRMFFRKFSEVSGGRFDAAAFQQKLENTRKAIKSGFFKTDKFKHVVKFKAEQVTVMDNRTYIGLENIQSNTGEYMPSEEKTSISSAGIFKQDDILFPKLRPYLNKVFHASFDGVCSTEFHILQALKINPAFFSFFLRSKVVVNQTTCLMTGNTLPRLQTFDIQNLDIPILPLEKQTEIAAHIQAIRDQAKQLRAEAAAGLEQAKREVEAMIIRENS